MSDLKREAHNMRMAANHLRREVADAPHKLQQADMFDRLAAEIEDYLERDDDGDIVTAVDPDAPALFGDET